MQIPLMHYSPAKSIAKQIFRAYDIRGIVDESLTAEGVYSIGRALGDVLTASQEKNIIVARDSRPSGIVLSKALIAGLMESGIDVIDIGECPTPILYFATHYLPFNNGVMLTGSHCPPAYNGLKIVIDNMALSQTGLQDLYQRICKGDFKTGFGSYQEAAVSEAYCRQLRAKVQPLKRKLKVVIDCGQGVASLIAPTLFKELQYDVVELFCDKNSTKPAHHPDPSDPKNLADLIKVVQATNADVGIAFDGDGDRLGLVTNKGTIIWPDRLLMCLAQEILAKHQNATVIYDVKCTRHLHQLIQSYQGVPCMWKTGHALIKDKMKETQALLAGEMSGHIFIKDDWYGFDDAIYAAARVLALLSAQTKTSDEFFAQFPNSVNTPELKFALADEHKFDFIAALVQRSGFDKGKKNTIDGLRVDFPEGWGLIRASNTTSDIVVRFEAEDEKSLLWIQELFREQILAVNKGLKLPF